MKLLLILVLTAAVMADSDVGQLLKSGNDQFTTKLFQEVVKQHNMSSVVLSAFSVLSPLAQLALASVGPSHDEILTTIGMPSDNVTKEAMMSLNTRIGAVKGVVLKQANKVYVRTGYTLNDVFAAVSKSVFNSDLQNIDFSNREGSANEINQWVEDNRNKRIKNLISKEAITSDTISILVNAIYFKGKWKTPFEKFVTREQDFYKTKDDTVRIPMMNKFNYFNYGESSELDAKLLEMPYEGDEASFVVILPNKYDGIDSLIEKLRDPAAFTKGLETMYYTDVRVALPKFKIETMTSLGEALVNIGVSKLFSSTEARLDHLVKEKSNLYVTSAIQKAFIEVNEEGAEAAAANAFLAGATSVGEQHRSHVFTADHPFVFFLMQKDIILFNGVFRS
ncbi:antichymotrypsin-2-like isoform X1 [Anticarsia gemmatalis]|uniref:antichymotrypsin-2-like isoform X1 n=1 Tax=Anticarsia gemmatalis TaxID=129554 RepID=UPI003F759307